MPTISPLPSILVEDVDITNADDGKATNGGASEKDSWLRTFWIYLCLVLVHWDLISDIPLDMYFRALFAKTPPRESTLTSSLQVGQKGIRCTVGQLALHPRLPLLAVCLTDSTEIILYNTGTSRQVRKFRVKLPKIVKSNGDMTNCVITCLKLSMWNKLAIGLSDGSVRVLEQNLAKILTSDQDEDKRVGVRCIKLLPDNTPDVGARFVGSITNLVFSVATGIMAGADCWLAIATQNSGVWIWNENSSQVIRVMNTVGINEGCLQWISLSSDKPKKRPIVSTPVAPEPKRLSESEIRKLGGIFGNADDISNLDEYFATPPRKKTPSRGIHFSNSTSFASSPYNRSDTLGSRPSVTTPPSAPVTDNGTLLIIGTKDGKIRFQKLFHSCRMMRLLSLVEFSPAAFAQPDRERTFTSMSGPASGEITHLIIHSPELTEIDVRVPILVACTGEKSGILHEFSVAVPRERFHEPFLSRLSGLAMAVQRSLINIVLSLTNIRHRLLFRQPPDSKLGRITYRTAHGILLSCGSRDSQKGFLTAAATLPGNSLVLMTLQADDSSNSHHLERQTKKTSECVIFSHDSLAATFTAVATINPLFPAPPPLAPSQPVRPKGFFSGQLYDAGILVNPAPEANEPPKAGEMMMCVHDFTCGQVAWGKNRFGQDIGAFAYQPASMLDPGVGIGKFEVMLSRH